MMKLNNKMFYYNEDDDYQVLGLPYVAEQLTFNILLSNNHNCFHLCEIKLTIGPFLNLIKNAENTLILALSFNQL